MNRLARFTNYGAENSTEETLQATVDIEQVAPKPTRELIITSLRSVYDPEIPVNIYDLGLIYSILIAKNGDVAIEMTLTAPGCPVAGMMPVMVKNAVQQVAGVGEVAVELVWDPPWSQANMSDEAQLQLGLL
ncbi:SUF system Fe-S cluster assembly protein [Thiospirillum jenense]|uniref:SUF system Fe-S cluster assembly protein n=1 Tax=Thiospirillum jenense TaxID=1653858 RepID=A0A839HNM3_9GAMM|nr:SUF system Fe-S cluster assembly protein [Thiospirillum jenense]MBB1126942.1 SUF system Fe-S cluster assembly protein [Thiospirillum jenense]